jgi:hypothetical protein
MSEHIRSWLTVTFDAMRKTGSSSRWTNHSYEALHDTLQHKHILKLFPFAVPTQREGFTLLNFSAPHNWTQASLLKSFCLYSSQSITLIPQCQIVAVYLAFLCSVPFFANLHAPTASPSTIYSCFLRTVSPWTYKLQLNGAVYFDGYDHLLRNDSQIHVTNMSIC